MKKLKSVKAVEVMLTAEQEAEAQRWAELFARKMKEEALAVARLLVAKKPEELLGKTEFELRDRVHGLGAAILETALHERKKGGTAGRA